MHHGRCSEHRIVICRVKSGSKYGPGTEIDSVYLLANLDETKPPNNISRSS